MQPQPDLQGNYGLIINSGEQLYQLAQELDVVEFEKKLPEYTRIIEQYFIDINKSKLNHSDIEDFETLLSMHHKIVSLIDKEKETLSKKLKKLHAGKVMQTFYPQTIL